MEHALISSQIYADSQRFENATERYLRLLNTKPEILLRAPMLHIASYLQMSPETLSRVRAAHLTEEIEKERSKKEQIEAQKAEYLKADTLKSDHKSVKTDSSLKSETAKSEGRNRTRENEKDEGEDAGVKNKKSAE